MLKEKRQMQIDELLRKDGEVTISQLSRMFGVAEMTIRRDLDTLAQQDGVVRTYGGAVLEQRPQRKQQAQTEIQDKEGKLALVKKALSFIEDGTTVFFDSGTTGLLLAQSVPASSHICALTNSIPVAMELVERPFVSVILIGGELKGDTLSCRGQATEEALERFRVDVAFVGVRAVGRGGELFSGSVAEAGLKKRILAAADMCFVLADSSKLSRQSLCRFADAREVDALITDDGMTPEQLARLAESGAEVVVAKTGLQRMTLQG